MPLEIHHYFEKTTNTFSYLVACQSTKQAVVIDPVLAYDPVSGETSTEHVSRLITDAAKHGYAIELILETHAHADHLSAAAFVKEKTGAPIAIGEGICAVQTTFKKLFNLEERFPTDGRQFDRLIADGETFKVGKLEFRSMATPGHTRDSMSYIVEDAAFVGDTLFRPDYGSARCDFPGGDAELLFDSVQKLHALADGTRLFLCHDYPAEGNEPRCMVPVEESRAQNVHLKEGSSKADFVEWRNKRDAGLSLPRLILPSLQVNIRAGTLPPAESNGVAYMKIPIDQDMSQL